MPDSSKTRRKNICSKNPKMHLIHSRGADLTDLTEKKPKLMRFCSEFRLTAESATAGGAAEAPGNSACKHEHSTPSTERLYYYDKFNILDAGDFVNEDRDALFAEVQEYVRELVKNNVRFTMVGGDHSVTIPVERGIDDALDEEFGIIHIDAHMDLCDAA